MADGKSNTIMYLGNGETDYWHGADRSLLLQAVKAVPSKDQKIFIRFGEAEGNPCIEGFPESLETAIQVLCNLE